MRVVVTGGTGFIGSHLVRTLADRGDEVVVLSRGSREGHEEDRKNVTTETWNPYVDGEWTHVLAGADAVVHLSGAPVLDERWTEERIAELERSRVVPAKILAAHIAKAEKKPVFVSGSAVGYYGMRTADEACAEDHPPGNDVLANICVAWEKAADPARDAGARVAHPRTGIVLGKHGGALSKMLPAFKAFCGGPIGDGKQALPWIHIEDAVRALLFAIDTPDFSGPFNVTAPGPVTMNEFARDVGCALGRPAICRVPAFAAKLALGDRSKALLTGQRAVPKKLDNAKFAFLFPELRGALDDLFRDSKITL